VIQGGDRVTAPLVLEKLFDFSQHTERKHESTLLRMTSKIEVYVKPPPNLQKNPRSATYVSMDERSMKCTYARWDALTVTHTNIYIHPNYWTFKTIYSLKKYSLITYMPLLFIPNISIDTKNIQLKKKFWFAYSNHLILICL
jgi:hypothetical protein